MRNRRPPSIVLLLILLAANLVALALIFRTGDVWERLAVILVTAAIFVTPLVEHFHLGNARVAVAAVDVILFLGLWFLAERAERWWLTAAAGFQLISVGTFAIPWIIPDTFLVWTGVTIRLLAWGLISITLFVGAWESWAARRFAREANHANPDFRGSRQALAPPQQ